MRFSGWSKRLSVFALALTLAFFDGAVCGDVHAATARSAKPVASATQAGTVSAKELEAALPAGIQWVEEFRAIREMAQELGLRVYLYGGSASALAHYQRWDLERAKGSGRLPESAFGYELNDIFRTGQDVDLALDGDPSRFEEFNRRLNARFPRSPESGKWEPRPLRVAAGHPGSPDHKPALLDSPDFALQTNDTGSIGAVEITDPPKGEPRVRDLTRWNGKKSSFLEDASKGVIRFLPSKDHLKTSRASAGNNPEIIAAIRYLTKVSQYNLEPSPGDLQAVARIVKDFDPKAPLGSYPKYWVERYAAKMFTQSSNLEKTYALLDETGLRARLKESSSISSEMRTFLDRAPLPSFKVGTGKGRTAAQIAKARGVSTLIAAHDSRTYEAMESILRGHYGRPNALLSRPNSPGENAAHGVGFYATLGEKAGAWNTGLTTRFEFLPEARENTDFVVVYDNEIRVLNGAAVRITDYPGGTADPLEYFRTQAKGTAISAEEKIRLNYMRKGLAKAVTRLSASEKAELRTIALSPRAPLGLRELWVRLMAFDPKERAEAFKHLEPDHPFSASIADAISLAGEILETPGWGRTPQERAQLEKAIGHLIDVTSPGGPQRAYSGELIGTIARKPAFLEHPVLVEKLFAAGNGERDRALIYKLLGERAYSDRADLALKIWARASAQDRRELSETFFSAPKARLSDDTLKLLRLASGEGHGRALVPVLLQATDLPDREQLLTQSLRSFGSGLSRAVSDRGIVMEVLKDPIARKHPEWVFMAANSFKEWHDPQGEAERLKLLRDQLLEDPHWSNEPAVAGLLSRNPLTMKELAEEVRRHNESVRPRNVAEAFEAFAARLSDYKLEDSAFKPFAKFLSDPVKATPAQIKRIRKVLETIDSDPNLADFLLQSSASELPELQDLVAKAAKNPAFESYLSANKVLSPENNPGYLRKLRWIQKLGTQAALENQVQELVFYVDLYRSGNVDDLKNALAETRQALQARTTPAAPAPAAVPALQKAAVAEVAEPKRPATPPTVPAPAAASAAKTPPQEIEALDAPAMAKFLRSEEGAAKLEANPELFDTVLKRFRPATRGPDPVGEALLTGVMSRKFAKSHPEWVDQLRERRNASFLAKFRTEVLHSPEWKLALGKAPVAPVQAAPASAAETARLLQSLPDGIGKVEEFRYIRDLARELGVRVHLYGGAASAMTHYQRWELERAKGSARLPSWVFDHDLDHIFRPGQDIDLAVDGDATRYAEFVRRLEKKYPRGADAGKWEPRPLRRAVGTKGAPDYHPALLNDADFALQNNDTGSIGAVEITDPPGGESRVRDLTDWDGKKSRFLDDAAAGKIRFLRNAGHSGTARARAGDNPEILSAIRYLTKVSQYNLEPSTEDLSAIREIVAATDSRRLGAGYPKYWIDRYAAKLIDQSTDLEKTHRLLRETGLDRKLQEIPGVSARLSTLLNKRPLPSFPVGQGDGKTAAELAREKGLAALEAAHDTREVAAVESLLRGQFGRLNAYTSEGGRYGQGFYAKLGNKGAWKNGYTIQFTLLPEARLGTDFVIDNSDEIRLLNVAAARVVDQPRSFQDLLQPGDFARLLLDRVRDRTPDFGVTLMKFQQAVKRGKVPAEDWKVLEDYLERSRKMDKYTYRTILGEIDMMLQLAATQGAPKAFSALAYERADTMYKDPAYAMLRPKREALFAEVRERLDGASVPASTGQFAPRIPRTAKTLEQIKQSPNMIQRQFDIGEFGRWYMNAVRNPSEADEAAVELNGLVRYLDTLPSQEKSDAAETLLRTLVQQRSMDDLENARRLNATKVAGVDAFVAGTEKQVLQENLRGQPAGFTTALQSLMRQHIHTPRISPFDCASGYSRFR